MGLILDISYALRLLAKSPKFTLLTLSIIVGSLSICFFTFNFAYTISYKSLDLPEFDKILAVEIDGDYPQSTLSTALLNSLSTLNDAELIKDKLITKQKEMWLANDGRGKQINSLMTNESFYQFIGIEPLHGRAFERKDMLAGSGNVVALSYKLWQNQFGAEKSVIGSSILLDRTRYQIIAVLPANLKFPYESDVVIPYKGLFDTVTEHNNTFPNLFVRVFGNKDIVETNIQAEFSQQYMAQLTASEQENVAELRLTLTTMQEYYRGANHLFFGLLNSVVFLVLLMACINIGNLLLARAIERRKETAIRAALGARQSRLIQQLVCEGGILTLVGTLLAILVGGVMIELTNQFMQNLAQSPSINLPPHWEWQLDLPTLAASLFFFTFILIFSCVIPAVKATKMNINDTLKDGTRGAVSIKTSKRTNILIGCQIFLISLFMMLGSLGSTAVNKVQEAVNVEGTKNVYYAEIDLSNQYSNRQSQVDFIRALLSKGLLSNEFISLKAELNTQAKQIRINNSEIEFPIDVSVTTGKFEAFASQILTGRDFIDTDNINASKVVIISQPFADAYFSGEDPIGQRIEIKDNIFNNYQIIGVVENQSGNTQSSFAQKEDYHELYLSLDQVEVIDSSVYIYFKTIAAEEVAFESFYNLLEQVNPAITPSKIRSYMDNSQTFLNLLSKITDIIINTSAFALFLALSGIYGITSNRISMASNEIGVRRALGAKDKSIIIYFIKKVSKPVFIGLLTSTLCYYAISSLFAGFLNNIVSTQGYVNSILLTLVVVVTVVILSIYIPANRSVKMEPITNLRID